MRNMLNACLLTGTLMISSGLCAAEIGSPAGTDMTGLAAVSPAVEAMPARQWRRDGDWRGADRADRRADRGERRWRGGRDGRDWRDRWVNGAGERRRAERDWRRDDWNRDRWDQDRRDRYDDRRRTVRGYSDSYGYAPGWGYDAYRDWAYDNDRRRSDYRAQGQYSRWNPGWRRDNRYDWAGYRRQYRDLYRPGPYSNPYRGRSYSRFSIGLQIGAPYYNSRYWIAEPSRYRLPDHYGPYRWVRYYDDVLLVNTRSGYIDDALYGFFW